MSWRIQRAVSRWSAVCCVVLGPLAASSDPAAAQRGTSEDGGSLRARISTTAYGVPHVEATNLAGAGFGHGYALAATDICTIADRWVTVRAERSRFFGVEGKRDGRQTVTNLQSDFYWQWLIDRDVVGAELRQAPPAGPIPEVREMVRGYVAGYNHYLEQVGVGNLPDARCRGQAWVRPITERDVYLRALHTAIMLNSSWIGPTVDAVRPGQAASGPRSPSPGPEAEPRLTMSNVIALGRDGTDNGKGMVFINPHWRWHEPERFFEIHLTVPGVLDVYGGTFPGNPFVLLGFNRNVAWSHTASVPKRETVYQLRLAPGDPTSYQYEGATRRISPRVVSVDVLGDDGRLTRHSHTFWETHFGPVIANGTFVWTTTTAYAVRTVSTGFRWLNQQYEMNAARSAEGLDLAGRRYMALGWLNTVAADDQGRVIYGDRSSVPHVTDAMRAACTNAELGKDLWSRQQLIVFDGWRKECEWGTDPDAPVPGIFGPKRLPMLDRWDYATNSNDSHWANHASTLLEGFDAIIGDERTPRSLRTRSGLHKIEARLRGTDGRPGQRFSLADLETITMDNRVYSAELWRDPLVTHCRTLPVQKGIPEACDVLAAWDMTDDIDSPGAVLWRRFMENLTQAAQPEAELFTVPFDPKDPMATPRGLNAANPRITRALTAAIGNLRDTGIPLAARLRDYQIEERAGQRIPIPGGPAQTGQYNLVLNGSGWVPGKGWNTIVHATSYVAWVQFTDRGPVGRSLLASSQSNNPDSRHHADQTLLFSRKESKPILFDRTDIEADPTLKVVELCRTAAGRSCQGN